MRLHFVIGEIDPALTLRYRTLVVKKSKTFFCIQIRKGVQFQAANEFKSTGVILSSFLRIVVCFDVVKSV